MNEMVDALKRKSWTYFALELILAKLARHSSRKRILKFHRVCFAWIMNSFKDWVEFLFNSISTFVGYLMPL